MTVDIEGGGGPSGKNCRDTYSKMLQVLFGMTPSLANGIINSYPTLSHLRSACLALPSEEAAAREFENISVGLLQKSFQMNNHVCASALRKMGQRVVLQGG